MLNLLTSGLLTLSLFSHSLTACINTTYSRTDEVEVTDELLPLILGAFPHHGNAFYEQELIRTRKILDAQPADFHARNDLGAAYTKLEQWDLAQAEFEKNEKLHSGRYETASNLGVMYKKKGDFEQAEKYISKALEIKPGGHMGLGNYYLKMIQWLGNANESDILEKNFLGARYDEGPEASAKSANETYVITLIKNDYHFPDAYIVLGDILFSRGDYQLAYRAYLRAGRTPSSSSHSHYGQILSQRLQSVYIAWQTKKTFFQVTDRLGAFRQVQKEIQEASRWLEQFQEIESDLISQGKPTTYANVLATMKEESIFTPTFIEAGIYTGFAYDITSALFILAIGLVITVYIISFLRRRRTRHP